MKAQHHRVIKISLRCEECRNSFDHYTTRPESSKINKKLCDNCERRRAYIGRERRKEKPIVDKAEEALKPKKFLQRRSIHPWNITLTIKENAANLKISVSYAYRYASCWGLKYKYDHKAGQKALDRPLMEHDTTAPSQQRYAWDGIPETLLLNSDGEKGENSKQDFSWDEACYLI